MTKYTPGPWTIGDESSTSVMADVEYSGRTRPVPVALCYDPNDHSHRTATGEANARLISAAPDMAEALLKVAAKYCGCSHSRIDDWHHETCHVPAVRAALQKAGLL